MGISSKGSRRRAGLARAVRAASPAALFPGLGAAAGDVLVRVDAAGDLWLLGGDAGDTVRIFRRGFDDVFTIRSAFSRCIGGLAPRNAVVRMSTSPDVPCAAWEPSDLAGGRGKLILVTDTTWIAAGESLDVLENFQAFLQREPKIQPVRQPGRLRASTPPARE